MGLGVVVGTIRHGLKVDAFECQRVNGIFAFPALVSLKPQKGWPNLLSVAVTAIGWLAMSYHSQATVWLDDLHIGDTENAAIKNSRCERRDARERERQEQNFNVLAEKKFLSERQCLIDGSPLDGRRFSEIWVYALCAIYTFLATVNFL